MILACDVGFRNFGYCIIDNKTCIKTGLIQSGIKKKNTEFIIHTVFTHNNVIKNEFEIPKTKYKTEYYSNIIQVYTKEIQNIIITNDVDLCICEMPHTGGQDFRSTFMMGLASSFIVTILEIMKIKLIQINPLQVKNYLKKKTGVHTPGKQESINFVKENTQIPIPKQKGLSHHISDAYISYMVFME